MQGSPILVKSLLSIEMCFFMLLKSFTVAFMTDDRRASYR